MVQMVMPMHTNSLGSLFGGQMVAWIDMAAS
ncbi:MAG: acyl-CoA thioesterase, partial [Sulfobacillus sp.]